MSATSPDSLRTVGSGSTTTRTFVATPSTFECHKGQVWALWPRAMARAYMDTGVDYGVGYFSGPSVWAFGHYYTAGVHITHEIAV